MQERPSPDLSRKLTLTATLAALYVLGRIVPVSQLIGTRGTITAGGIIAPLIGIMLEPSYGVAAVLIGTMVGSLVPWNPLKFAGFDFLPGALNVVIVSFAVRGKKSRSIVMFLFMLGLFLVTPNTEIFVGKFYSPPVPYLWLHLVALIVLISPLSNQLATRLNSTNRAFVLLAVTVLAFTGTMIEHVTGGILYALFAGGGALFAWPFIYLAYPIERAALVAGAVLVCTPTIILLRSVIRERIAAKSSALAPGPTSETQRL
ncbi:MAG TPA: hypothetical protein VFE98_01355 [Candidatus Bathyarchaeia archaeon]|nr:hypothetical protein [Candidatus Bathyarchaeia archaeon]